METGDVLGIVSIVFGGASIAFCLYVVWLYGVEMNIFAALVFAIFLLLAYILFIGLSVVGIILAIIGIAKTKSKYGIVGLLLSIGGFLWLVIPMLMILLNPTLP